MFSFLNGKKWFFKTRSFLVAQLSHLLMKLVMKTCRIHLEGIEQFCQLALKEKCILMLWHNRLAIVPFILSHYTTSIEYAALVSGSRDGEILSTIIRSYPNAHVIPVPHQARYQALREMIHHLEEKKHVVIITPDGPRGPRYEVKPGLAVAALETQAYVVPFNWEARQYWELKTWDRLRLPKPFTTIHVKMAAPIRLQDFQISSLKEAQVFLKEHLSK